MIRSGVARVKRQTSRRVLVRTLVVGGLAGAAWLLSASAAQAAAAEPVDRSTGSVLVPLGGVLETAKPVLSTAEGLLGGALAPATTHGSKASVLTHAPVEQPVPTGRTAMRRVSSDPAVAVVAPSTTAKRSISIADAAPALGSDQAAVRTADRAGVPDGSSNRSANRPGARVSGLAGIGLVAPLGVTRALAVPGALLTPVAQVALPALAPVTAFFRPMTSMLRFAVVPLFSTVGVVARTVTGTLPGPRGRPTSVVTPNGLVGVHGGVSSGTTGTTAPGAATPATLRAAHTETSTVRQHAGRPERAVETVSSRNKGDAPSLPYPVPTRGEGSASGTPANAAGSPMGGGAFATVPSSVADSMLAYQLLPKSADTVVPRRDAEEPTVSPD
ncbi:hypothetical protein Ais01nite_84330 [Asanoa ishikariensis]|uniref:Uncharacterized protein n=1 Tax=Asanoa ishikariensis TaxID=137265 RepID=A0A1H3KEW8_9ACTN|nr:hypothetical protein [Asanoa ishikariensis]GIF70398.1 hypothetical protein Ais01nite_84330 [Asanoa ishikariensis]SDY50148.1 hypothetical protein SAMN05421684_0082 [Asanoa ishikariensis]